MELIHYGCKKINPRKFTPIKNRKWCKPYGGFWSSPVNSKYGWKDFCETDMTSGIPKLFVKFKINKYARILKIDTLYDLEKVVSKYRIKSYSCLGDLINYEQLSKDYDAIWLTDEGQCSTRLSEPNLYGWDVETVFIMNPKII